MYTLSLVTHLLGFALFASAVPFMSLERLADSSPAQASSLVPDMPPYSKTLNVARRMNSTGSPNVLKFDQARARAMRQRAQTDGRPTSSDAPRVSAEVATSQAVSYVVTVLIGEPPMEYNLLVDTGSSNTWVGANSTNRYLTPSMSSQPTGEVFHVQYGSGEVIGIECLDSITLADGLTLRNQSIGQAYYAKGFAGVDGILGIGPSGLTQGSFMPDDTNSANTVTDTAWYQNLLDTREIGINFEPSDKMENKNGQLTYGGIDKTKFTGDMYYTPLTTISPASNYVGVDQEILYGSDMVLENSPGILDTGTTLILLATDAYKRYKNLTGGIPDAEVGLLCITPDQYANLHSLYFNIGGNAFELIPNAQIWPRALNSAIGGNSSCIYLIVNDLGTIGGGGLDFINGMTFLERFYMVYDIGGSRAGLAYTPWTYEIIN